MGGLRVPMAFSDVFLSLDPWFQRYNAADETISDIATQKVAKKGNLPYLRKIRRLVKYFNLIIQGTGKSGN